MTVTRPTVLVALDGDRVLILQDGQRMGDLSSQSGDHGVTVNPATQTVPTAKVGVPTPVSWTVTNDLAPVTIAVLPCTATSICPSTSVTRSRGTSLKLAIAEPSF